MEEKNEIKISLKSSLLIIAIIAIIIVVMGCFIYKLYNEKCKESEKVSDLNGKVSNLESTISVLESEKTKLEETEQSGVDLSENNNNQENTRQVEDNSSYIKNFAESVSKELGKGNDICVKILNDEIIFVNNKGEAYLQTYLDNQSSKQILANNVVNVWFFRQGNGLGDEVVLFLKKDGTLTYMGYNWDEIKNKLVLDTHEKVLENAKNIVDAIEISGDEENGIGGAGFLLIKSDGTCMPYFYFRN